MVAKDGINQFKGVLPDEFIYVLGFVMSAWSLCKLATLG